VGGKSNVVALAAGACVIGSASTLRRREAALVEDLDQAARENLVISLRMSQSMTEKSSQLVILDPMKRSTIFNQDSTDMVGLLQSAVDFLIARRCSHGSTLT
jgi:hypothetical protein